MAGSSEKMCLRNTGHAPRHITHLNIPDEILRHWTIGSTCCLQHLHAHQTMLSLLSCHVGTKVLWSLHTAFDLDGVNCWLHISHGHSGCKMLFDKAEFLPQILYVGQNSKVISDSLRKADLWSWNPVLKIKKSMPPTWYVLAVLT